MSAAPPTFDVTLRSARMLTPSVRELTFQRADGEPVTFDAGQWMSFVLPLPEGEMRRAYSIASPPDGDTFDIAVTHVDGGPGSTYLHALEPGATLRAIGPQGFFTRPRSDDAPALFIATGTGVTPLRSMVRDALAHGHVKPMIVLVGVREEQDRLYHEELEALAAAHPQLRVEYTLSRGKDGWTGRRGYVQTHVPELFRELEPSGAPHAWICGLERMVSAVRNVLRKDMSLPRQQVHSERYD